MKQRLLFQPGEEERIVLPYSLELLTIVPIGLDLLGSWMKKRPISRTYLGLCPFHSEKTPSFYLRPRTNDYICYGCGIRGYPLSLPFELFTRGTLEYGSRAPRIQEPVNYFIDKFKFDLNIPERRGEFRELFEREGGSHFDNNLGSYYWVLNK